MAWDDDLTPEHRAVASHIGSHARLLAGPGTGKTRSLTRRVCFLVEERDVEPEAILALTFTRAAAYELRTRVEAELGEDRMPHIATLHSFALRQLLRNSDRIQTLPQPIRIADDWEERYIILEDLKSMLHLSTIRETNKLLIDLSADWQTLNADQSEWEQNYPNPAFLGAWQEHRQIYRYVLRSELVYQLKRAIESHGDFDLEGPPEYLLVDEYQDLNRCDQAIIEAICDRGAEVFVAGDDDQSIYGFRKAHPVGIRQFVNEYEGAVNLTLDICKRCDSEILDLGLFVARQDYNRLEKSLRADEGREGGTIGILRFANENSEGVGVARLCQYLIDNQGLNPDEILILLRTDRNKVFSSLLVESLEQYGIPVAASTAEDNPFNGTIGRIVLATLRLLIDQNDHLAWRTLIQLRPNRLGEGAIHTIYEYARSHNNNFAQVIHAIHQDDTLIISRYARLVNSEVDSVLSALEEIRAGRDEEDSVIDTLEEVINRFVFAEEDREPIKAEFEKILGATEAGTIQELLHNIEASDTRIEQEVEAGQVNILTMHKAKGLTSKAVIIVAAENEYFPPRDTGAEIGDERRLLYVSLTRAKNYLFVTYCDRRVGRQRYTGRTSGQTQRTLTNFLRHGPRRPEHGTVFTTTLES